MKLSARSVSAFLSIPLAALACGPAMPQGDGVETTKTRDRDAQLASSFDKGEDEILRDLAAIDRRFAQRAHITASEDDLRRVAMNAIMREDPTVAVIDGAIDPFSFDARARGLEAAKQKSTALPILPTDLRRTTERDLLVRAIDAELLRLDEERALPRSASSIIRAIIETWRDARDAREVAEVDRWLARRLVTIRESMKSSDPASALDVVRARELDDELDELEKRTSIPGFTHTTQELVLVRDALEAAASRPAAKAQSSWDAVAKRTRAHLGLTSTPEILSRELADLETELRARADRALGQANVKKDTLAIDKQVFAGGPCIDAIPGSPIRSMGAPHEREAACHLRHLVARIEDEASRGTALAIMHDHVVLAEWALDVARGSSTIAETQGKHRLFVPILPDTRARYERIALARPVAALGAAEAVRVLVKGGADPKARAAQWSASIGDVPFDVAMKELESSNARQAKQP